MSAIQKGEIWKMGYSGGEIALAVPRNWVGPITQYTREDITGEYDEIITKIGKDKRYVMTGTFIALKNAAIPIPQAHEFVYLIAPTQTETSIWYVEKCTPTYTPDILSLDMELVRLAAWDVAGAPLVSGYSSQFFATDKNYDVLGDTLSDDYIETTDADVRCDRIVAISPNGMRTVIAENITNTLGTGGTLERISFPYEYVPTPSEGDVIQLWYFFNRNYCPLCARVTITEV